MKRFLVYPDVLIYLRVNPEVSMQRIQERGRDGKQNHPRVHGKTPPGIRKFHCRNGSLYRVLTLDWNEYKEPEEG